MTIPPTTSSPAPTPNISSGPVIGTSEAETDGSAFPERPSTTAAKTTVAHPNIANR